MKLGWTNDTHLDVCGEDEINDLIDGSKQFDAVVLCGDISNGKKIEQHLEMLVSRVHSPIYFVTGNHDAWYTSVADLEPRMSLIASKHRNHLFYLPECGPVRLSDTTALLGENGWGDCRWGMGAETNTMTNDWRHVKELNDAARKAVYAYTVREIADADARNLKRQIDAALSSGFRRLIIATHVPPWPGASMYRGEQSCPDDLAHYACKAIGDTIMDAVHANTDTEFLVICGHTHGAADYRPRGIDNLRCLSGGQSGPHGYGEPKWQEAIEVK